MESQRVFFVAQVVKPPIWNLAWAMKKKPGCLTYIGDDIMPSFVGIMIN